MLSKERIIIGEIALSLHSGHGEELCGKLPDEGLADFTEKTDEYKIEGNSICFFSITARNSFLAAYLFEKNREAFRSDPHQWINTAHTLWRDEIGRADSVAGRLLALVHNKIQDVFIIAAEVVESGLLEVFDVLFAVTAAFPYVEKLEPQGIILLCSAQHDRTKGDYFAGTIFNNLGKVLPSQPEVCRAIHTHLKSHVNEAIASLHPTALLSLAKTLPDEALALAMKDAESSNALMKSVALWTLGCLVSSSDIPEPEIPKVAACIIGAMSDAEPQIRQSAIRAAALSLSAMEIFDEIMIRLGEVGDQYVLSAIAGQLMLNIKKMKGKVDFNVLIGLMSRLAPQTEGAIGNYDQILRQLLAEEGQVQLAITSFTEWTRANYEAVPQDMSFTKMFESAIAEFIKNKNLLSRVITEWFLSDDKHLPQAAAEILSHVWARGLKNPEFYISTLDDLEERDFLFLARRMLGFVTTEDHLLSLSFSILKTKDAPKRAFGIAYALLVNELGLDYPDSVIKALEKSASLASEPAWIDYFSSMREEIKRRVDELDALPRLAELSPPSHVVRQFAKARAEQMRISAEEAQKGSIIRQLATQIPIKAGHAWFSFREGGYTSASTMKSFSHSITLPRRHVVDEVGYELRRLGMRLAKRGAE